MHVDCASQRVSGGEHNLFSLSLHSSSKVRSLHGWFHTATLGLKETNGKSRSAGKQ